MGIVVEELQSVADIENGGRSVAEPTADR